MSLTAREPPKKSLKEFIATGIFTREATREGAQPLDMIEGYNLSDMLKKLHLEVNFRIIEEAEVQQSIF